METNFLINLGGSGPTKRARKVCEGKEIFARSVFKRLLELAEGLQRCQGEQVI